MKSFTIRSEFLVIGSGIAGLSFALKAAEHGKVVVVTKKERAESNTNYAQGGIASVFGPDDSFEVHLQDTLKGGAYLCHHDAVELVVREGPQRVYELVNWGTEFTTKQVGNKSVFDLGREGGHSHHRIVHALGDATGREVMRAVINRAVASPNIEVWPETFTIDLVTEAGVCRGALVWHPQRGKTLIWARRTILATGGAGQIYRESTNPAGASGDGIALAWRAGATVRDMEFMQFHPTVLYIAGGSRSLITEAVRGAGAHLIDRAGRRFMPEFDPRGELAPRDVVSRAITEVMRRTAHANVYLDLSHLDAVMVRQRFPGMAKLCQKFGLDLATDRIPVRPGAHYMIGGVVVDEQGRTSVPHLLAAGEVTSSGLHGANRLASNSLLEGLVFGSRAGEQASRDLAAEPTDGEVFAVPMIANQPVGAAAEGPPGESLDLADIRNSLRSLMWRHVGVERSGASLSEAADTVASWCRYVLPRQFANPQGWQLQNLLEVGRLMIQAATARCETRGVHVRSDFPESSPAWHRHLCWQRDRDEPWFESVKTAPPTGAGVGDCRLAGSSQK